MSELPEGWSNSTIGEVATCITGNTPPKNDPDNYGGHIPLVKPTQLTDRTVSEAEEYISELGAKKARILEPGSVLVSCIGNLGKTAFNTVPVAFNQQINAAVFGSSVEPRYGFYFFQSRQAREQLEALSSATTIAIVNKSKFQSVRIPIAPLPEQHRIVSKIEELISKLDAGVAALKQAKAQLKRYRQSVLAAAVTGELTKEWRANNPNTEPASVLLNLINTERRRLWLKLESEKHEAKGKIPKNDKWKERYPEPQTTKKDPGTSIPSTWEWVSWDSVGLSQNGRAFPSNQYSDTGTKLLRPGNLHHSGEVRWTDKNTRRMPSSWEDEHPAYIVGGGELVMNLTAQSLADEFLGRICMTPPNEHCLLNQRIARLLTVVIDSKFALYLLKAKPFRRFVDNLNTGSLIQHMFTSQLADFEFGLPPLEEQKQIVAEVEARLTSIDHIESELDQQLARANRLRQSILSTAFKGHLSS